MNQITESWENMSFHENILLTGRSDWPTGSQERPMSSPWIRAGWWNSLPRGTHDTSHIGSYKSFLSIPHYNQAVEEAKNQYLNNAIDILLKEKGQDDWDGEEALAVSSKTANVARSLIGFFSFTDISPDVDATPHGEIDFNFDISENTLLTIRSCPSGDIVFSGIFREGNLTQEMSRFMNAFFEGLNSAAYDQHRRQWVSHLATAHFPAGGLASVMVYDEERTVMVYDEEGMVMP